MPAITRTGHPLFDAEAKREVFRNTCFKIILNSNVLQRTIQDTQVTNGTRPSWRSGRNLWRFKDNPNRPTPYSTSTMAKSSGVPDTVSRETRAILRLRANDVFRHVRFEIQMPTEPGKFYPSCVTTLRIRVAAGNLTFWAPGVPANAADNIAAAAGNILRQYSWHPSFMPMASPTAPNLADRAYVCGLHQDVITYVNDLQQARLTATGQFVGLTFKDIQNIAKKYRYWR